MAQGALLYLTATSAKNVLPHIDAGTLGFLNTPATNLRIREGWTWAADNGCYGKNYVGDRAWFDWLLRVRESPGTCLFATAPDVVGDFGATLERARPWLGRIRTAGLPAALVAQDGATSRTIPWSDCDAVFIGGTTGWKLGSEAEGIVVEGVRRGVHVHVGRVNSWRRFSRFAALGADSADGNYIAFGPERNLPRVLGWIARAHAQPSLMTPHLVPPGT